MTITSSKVITNATIELDPFGGDTNQSANGNSQPYKYTSYERDGDGSDYAMARSRNTWFSRFYQPDPYDGSYNMADPQSFNRYAYTQNDPVNFVDPSGLNLHEIGHSAAAEDDGDVIRIYTWAPSWNWGWGGGGGGGGRIQPVRPLDPIDGGGGGGQTHETGHTSPQTTCDFKLADLFGGEGSVAATVNEPFGIDPLFAGDNRIHHLANNGVLHIYGNAQGTATDAGLYRPPGGTFLPKGSGEYEEKDEYGGTGNYSNVFQFAYSDGLVIKFFHVGGTSGGVAGGARLGRYSGQMNAQGSVRIGNVGGIGGHASSRYIHSHIEFRVNGRRTDPRKIYCGY